MEPENIGQINRRALFCDENGDFRIPPEPEQNDHKESRFVCEAMSSISEMILPTCCEASLMRDIASIMAFISLWLRSASSAYVRA